MRAQKHAARPHHYAHSSVHLRDVRVYANMNVCIYIPQRRHAPCRHCSRYVAGAVDVLTHNLCATPHLASGNGREVLFWPPPPRLWRPLLEREWRERERGRGRGREREGGRERGREGWREGERERERKRERNQQSMHQPARTSSGGRRQRQCFRLVIFQIQTKQDAGQTTQSTRTMRCPTSLHALRAACQLDPACHPATYPQSTLQAWKDDVGHRVRAYKHNVGAQGEGEGARHRRHSRCSHSRVWHGSVLC